MLWDYKIFEIPTAKTNQTEVKLLDRVCIYKQLTQVTKYGNNQTTN